MVSANHSILLPVQKSTIGGVSLTQIECPSEMEDWGEEVSGPLSPTALSVIEEFFGVKPKITSWVGVGDSMVPNSYEFSVRGTTRGTELIFRIWQYGVGNDGRAEIDLWMRSGKFPGSDLYCTEQKAVWVGTGHGQLLVATEHGVLYRATRQRSSKQSWRGLFKRFSKVKGFWIEMTALRARLNGSARYVPAHLR